VKRQQPALCTPLKEIFTYYLDTDKGTLHSYDDVYEELFRPYRESAKAVLEIGTRYGGSLRAWRDYFQVAKIYGVDNGEEDELWTPIGSSRITVFRGDSTKPEIQDKLEDIFQIIIDDGSHAIQDQIETFKNLLPLLDKKGLYITEDLENIEYAQQMQNLFGGTVIDLRHIKNRHDDILWIYKNENPSINLNNTHFPTYQVSSVRIC